MAYQEIEPGQKDWLNALNKMLKSDSFNSKLFQCTMTNGATGWGTQSLIYNDDIYIAQVNAWFTVPGSGPYIDFMDNPLSSVMSFSNSTVTQTVTLSGNQDAANNGYGRVVASAGTDNGVSWGLYATESSAHIYKQSPYSGLLHVVFVGNRSELKI